MIKFFSRIFGKKLASPLPRQTRVIAPFPDDYAAEVKSIVKLIRNYSDETTEEEIESVNEFFFNTTDWIDQGHDVNLDSFYDLIVAIMKYMLSEVATDGGNDFRLDHELYLEGVKDKSFFVDPDNEKFVLKIIDLGPEADHFLCELLHDFGSELEQSFIDQSLDILLKRSTLNICNHAAGWVEVPGNVFAELIGTNRLSESQLEKVINFLDSTSKDLDTSQIEECKFQLAQNSKTPSGYLSELTQYKDLVFGWVWADEKNGEWIEISIAELAQKNLQARKSIE
jgi:hypothetical protein